MASNLSTVVVEGPLALRMRRLRAARCGEIGLQIFTLPQIAARLAGGFARPAQGRALDEAVRAGLSDTKLEELAPLEDLPGMVRALERTLERLWRAGVVLNPLAELARLRDLAALDSQVRLALPSGMLAPPDLARAAVARVALAPQVLGPVKFESVHELAPVWRDLVAAIAEAVPVTWVGAPKPPGAAGDDVATEATELPEIRVVACADPHHEVVEALRWARALIADLGVSPSDIAIVAASPGPWDDHMLALSAAAELPVHFSHGVPLLATRDGQACAALADVLVQGLSQERVRRVLGHGANRATALLDVPANPLAGVRPEALLGDLGQWRRALQLARSERRDGVDPETAFWPALELMSKGLEAAEEMGMHLLPRSAALHWSAALAAAPAVALSFSLQSLRVGDGLDPGANVAWAPAGHLMGAPRPWVRMLGMTARAWPRPEASDPLLPDHILALDPVASPGRAETDRQAFNAIRAGATAELVLSYGRRSRQGGRQAASPLVPRTAQVTVLRRMRTPEHAFSESDRLRARPGEAESSPVLARAQLCWRARRSGALSPYDGMLRPEHPAIVRVLARPQSATSLRRLLRDPLGYVWGYVLQWRDGVYPATPLALDDRAFGDLVHMLLQNTVNALEPIPGFGRASESEAEEALSGAVEQVGQAWPLERATPPPLLWRYTLELARDFAWRALTLDGVFAPGTRSWTEISFGDPDGPEPTESAPWDPRIPVAIRGADLLIRGAIDRLELSVDDRGARVTDYKTGLPPKNPAGMVLAGGAELQRVLYAAAVREHRPDARVQARLVFLNDDPPTPHRLAGDELDAAIEEATRCLRAGVDLVRRGVTLPGPDTEALWSPSRLALPATGEMYAVVKQRAFSRAFGAFDSVWRVR